MKGVIQIMRKLIALIVAAVMLLTLIPVMALTSSAAEVEGMWTTYRHAGDYYDPEDLEPGEEPPVYKPEAGYTYTDEGFKLYISISPRNAFSLKSFSL